MYKIRKGFKISTLKKDYNMYFHKNERVWGIGKPNQNNTYAIVIVNRVIELLDYENNKEFIDSFLKDLENRGLLTHE